jgi:glycosyltransferase involved in cell wall biosynthesis/peptidoglycan/xylan/chitin deacetylase (PgdA/CDA1 family)
LISFTFDDFPRSALLTGGAILNSFGLAGTYYASLGLAGKETASGEIFSSGDLTTLFEQGHELGCHTFAHFDSWDTDTGAFEDSIIKNRSALNELFPGAEFESFAYPISSPRPLLKARIVHHFVCCRGGGQTINVGRTDLNQLSAFFLEKSRDNIQAIKDVIDCNQRARGWLIFATHDVSDHPTPFGCTPEFFERVVRYAVSSGAQILPVIKTLEVLGAPGCVRARPSRPSAPTAVKVVSQSAKIKPLVSILIPTFNAQEWIVDTLCSAIGQTWERKEIIVVDDGSTDRTPEIARRFESDGVRVVIQKHQGASAARNEALSHCRGDYIQWLDADDLLAPDKIARQMAVLDGNADRRILLSSEFARFLYRRQRAKFVRTELWEDLSPTEWLFRKLGLNLYMQTATWLVSRELTEAAGLWDTRLLSDDDGEYFCRVLLASNGIRFVRGAKVYYRAPGLAFGSHLSYIGASESKIRAHWTSMQLHISYLLSLENSERVRAACLRYLQTCYVYYYPETSDIVQQMIKMAAELGGQLGSPRLSWKYSWMKMLLGVHLTKRAQSSLLKFKWSLKKSIDKTIFQLDSRRIA